jgi:hypothetical protein
MLAGNKLSESVRWHISADETLNMSVNSNTNIQFLYVGFRACAKGPSYFDISLTKRIQSVQSSI